MAHIASALTFADRIYKFVASNYGAINGTKFKETLENAYDNEANLTDEGKAKVKEFFITIMQREISRAYKTPNEVS